MKKKLLSALLGISAFLVVSPALAARAYQPANLDAFLDSTVQQPVAPVNAGEVAHVEERLGVPTFFWAPGRTEAHGYRQMKLSAVEAARRFLLEYGALYRQDPKLLAETAKVAHVHELDRGAVIVGFRKEVGGIRVFRDELKVIMNHDLDLVAISGYLPPHQKIGVRGEWSDEFRLSHETALTTALFDLARVPVEAQQLKPAGAIVDGYHAFTLTPSGVASSLRFVQPARVRQVLFTLPGGLEPAYYVDLDVEIAGVDEKVSRAYGYVISAVDGRVLLRNNHVAEAAYTYDVWSDADGHPWDGPIGNAFSPHPSGTPDGTEPTVGPQATITLDHGPISTNDPWLPAGATVTSGNNIDAYADLASPDGFTAGDLRPAVTAAGAFQFVYDFNVDPAGSNTQIGAAVTQMFVDTNFFHDWYYDVGFDEAAGNAQADNLGRGGIGNDVFYAEGQDFSGTDNANMSCPSDGAHPRMQMYLFNGNITKALTLTNSSGTTTTLNNRSAPFGAQNYTLTAPVVVANDGTGTTSDACEPITNNVAGQIVLVDRGTCTFVQKAKAVQDAGGIGCIIANNQGQGSPFLSGSDPSITIGVMSVSMTSGNTIKTAINNGGATITMTLSSSQRRDGTIDNAIVAHEWGHYISNRLIGDANGLDNNQGGGMGEGWGDFHSLLIIARPEDAQLAGNDKFQGVYPSATYVMTGGGTNGLYYGIRRVPYSTDFTKNALTFKHIQDGVALPTGVPTAFGQNGAQNSEVHNTGEVWATMLWECYAALLADSTRLTFQQAQDRMKLYLVGGYKGTPNSPTFVEARDAVLAAAFANDPADYKALGQAFARRGLGQKAVAPSRSSMNNSPVTEDFGFGASLFFVGANLEDDVTSCDQDGVLDNGETGTLSVTIRNSGAAPLTATTGKVTTTSAGVTLENDGALTFPTSQPFGTATATIKVSLNGATDMSSLAFDISYMDPALDAAPAPVSVSFRGNTEEKPASSATDTVESTSTIWQTGNNPQLNNTVFKREELSPTQHAWFGENPDSPADVWLVSPTMDVAPTGELIITFKHRYDFESDQTALYDGGVIELKADNGAWVDIGDKAMPGYDGALAPSPSSNPLRGRNAFAGQSAGYPAWVATTVNLGTAYAGKTIQLRFRIGADDAAAHKGWEIDDIAFNGIIGTPFTTVTAQTTVCGNHAPVANAGSNVTVTEGDVVTLAADGTDADGDPLTFTWTQVEGAMQTVESVDAKTIRFTAPQVDGELNLTFSLVANDGKENSQPALVNVRVKNTNLAPTAVIEVSGDAKRGGTVTLEGSKSTDPEGAALTYTWKQTGGVDVTLTTDGAKATFVVPDSAKDDSAIRFELVVNDGEKDSAPASVDVKIAGSVNGGGCGCNAGQGVGTAPLWMALIAAVALLNRKRRAGQA